MKTFVTFHCLVVLTLLCGCGRGSTVLTSNVGIDSIAIDTIVTLDSSDMPRCEISLHVAFFVGNIADKANATMLDEGAMLPGYSVSQMRGRSVEQNVDDFVEGYIANYKSFYSGMYKFDKENVANYNLSYNLRTKVFSEHEDVISYVATVTVVRGEISTKQTIARNINASTGEVLTLDNIYTPGYEVVLKRIVFDKLSNIGNKNKILFNKNDVYLPANFVVGHNKITLIYCEDEIAPHDVGEITIDVTNSEMTGMIAW